MRWEGGKRYGGIEDRRGMGGPVGIAGGGIGALALGILGYVFFGINPLAVVDIANQLSPPTQEAGRVGTPSDQTGQFVDTILSSTTDVWTAELRRMGGRAYEAPNPLVIYEQATGTQCGMGQSAMGPFYCPRDARVYLDLEFFNELSSRFGAPGDFARAYVLAHEIGHHVQNVLGTSERVQMEQRAGNQADANRYSVALELQADCYAGVWAAHASEASNGQVALEAGDLEEGLRAAAAVGDDTLQKQTRGRVVPDSFTHGSAAQRQQWLRRGYDSGDARTCDTFRDIR